MAIIEQQPLELETGHPEVVAAHRRVHPTHQRSTGWGSWFTTVDHKKIGIMYGVAAMFFFLRRWHRGAADPAPAGAARRHGPARPSVYNQVFTMHGVTMVFLVVMPLAAAFANYLMPLQIGARDVAFPRLNAFSFWCFLFGGIFLNTSWFLGGGADGGWFAYAPNTGVAFSPSHGIDFFAIGLQITGIASLVSAHQPDRHRAQHAGTGHDPDADAGLHLDAARHPVPAAVRPAGHHRGAVPADLRPSLRTPTSSTSTRAPTRCCGSTCSGSSVTPRSTS